MTEAAANRTPARIPWESSSSTELPNCNGTHVSNPESVRDHLSAAQWSFWYEGAPAANDINDPARRTLLGKGKRREGGGYADRMSPVTVWDTVMDEHNYLVCRWGEAIGIA